MTIAKVGGSAQPSLAAIRRNADHLLSGELAEEQRAALVEIEGAVMRLQTMFSDLADLAALEAGSFLPTETEFHLADAMREAVRVMRPQAMERGIDLSAAGLRTLPKMVIGDPGRLRQVLQHLLSNAIEATASGVVSLTTSTIADRADGAAVRFEIWDTGSGIATDDLERIFDPFETASNFPTFGGPGLGLTVADRLVQAMGGTISVQSRPDTGSVFSFELTFQKPEQPSTRIDLKQGPAWIVVISDAAGPSHLAPLLERFGHTVTAFAAPETAAASLGLDESLLPDLIIIAPTGRPFDMARRVAESPMLGRVPMLMVAPDGIRGEAVTCEALGLDGYLAQPVSPVDLMESVDLLRSRNRRAGSLVTRHLLRERRGSLKILVVDGSPTRRGALLRNLEPLGHRVEAVTNGSLGLAAITTGGYDAVIIDDEIDDLDCLSLARAIRRWQVGVGQKIRLVGVVPLGRAVDERRYRAAGLDDVVPRSAGLEHVHSALVAR